MIITPSINLQLYIFSESERRALLQYIARPYNMAAIVWFDVGHNGKGSDRLWNMQMICTYLPQILILSAIRIA